MPLDDRPTTAADSTPPPTGHVPPAHREGSVRETLESIVIAFVLAFVFRAFVVEAFVIPTGSMAPTLYGQHIRLICPQCGYRWAAGAQEGQNMRAGDTLACPMCYYPTEARSSALDSGDRILVLKYIYNFTEPRRWDVVVFKNPTKPEENYIKRLVGLPREELWIVHGNIYTRPLGPDDRPREGDWRIERKPAKVQRAVWQPVYDSDYQPLDGGKRESDPLRASMDWRMPWVPAGPTASRWRHAPGDPTWAYEGQVTEWGVMDFDFGQLRRLATYPYNKGASGSEPIEDLKLGATVVPRREGVRMVLNCQTMRMELRAMIEADGSVSLQRRGEGDADWTKKAGGVMPALVSGKACRVELWHVDQSLQLWADEKLIASWDYEGDPQALARMHAATFEPRASIEVEGSVELRSLELMRDLFYTQNPPQDRSLKPRGTGGVPAVIKSDRFYCLGDNSPESSDSRMWSAPERWVAYAMNVEPGYVPREMMIGRAFFVYFPAPWRGPGGFPGVPNFGDMRFIH